MGAWYVIAHRALDAAIWLVIRFNYAVIALLAGGSLREGIRDYGTLPLRDPEFRRTVARKHPHLRRRTMILIAITFVPLLLAVLVLVETVRDAVAGPRNLDKNAAEPEQEDPMDRPGVGASRSLSRKGGGRGTR